MDEGDVALATNAPPDWPLVRAPFHRPEEAAERYVRSVTARVRDTLRQAGFHVDATRRAVRLGRQDVRIDLVVEVAGIEIPVFVFPGEDPHREAAMYGFLRAALSEAEAFEAEPIYYAPDRLPALSHPSPADVHRLAEGFERRCGRGVAAHRTPREVVATLRERAGRAVEAGGGEAVQEAAAFAGEWIRSQTEATWMLREDMPRSVLAARNPAGTVQYYLPLFAWFPDAVRMGYDGLADLLEAVVGETAEDGPDGLTVRPAAYGPEVEAWMEATLLGGDVPEAAAVLRRCATCGRMARMHAPFGHTAGGLDEALRRCLLLAQVPIDACPCGAEDFRGAQIAYLLPGTAGSGTVALVYTCESHTRIAVCGLLRDPTLL